MKKTFLVLFLLICWYTTQAQFKIPSEEEASAVKGKTLLVVLPEGDGENDEYIKVSNEWLKEIIAATWKFSTKVEYVSATAAESMMESTNGTYAVLDQGKSSRMERKSANVVVKHEVWEFRIKIQNEKGKWKEAFTIPMLSSNLGYADLQFIIAQCQLYFESVSKGLKKKDIVNFEENLVVLKKKTLYLAEEQIKKDKEKIIEAYEGKVVFVSYEELEKKVIARNNDCLYVSYIFSDTKTAPVFIVVDAETMQVRGISGPGGLSLTVYSLPPPSNNTNWKEVWSISFRSKLGVGKSELNGFFNKTAQSLNNGM